MPDPTPPVTPPVPPIPPATEPPKTLTFAETLIEISRLAGDNAEVMNLLKTLQQPTAAPPATSAPGAQGEDYKAKYEALQQQYREAFFNNTSQTPPPIPPITPPAVPTIDSLFKPTEKK